MMRSWKKPRTRGAFDRGRRPALTTTNRRQCSLARMPSIIAFARPSRRESRAASTAAPSVRKDGVGVSDHRGEDDPSITCASTTMRASF